MSVTTFSTIRQQQLTSTQPSRSSTVIRNAAIGGVIGAAAAAGLSLTALPFIGALAAPIAAAIGGAAGIVIGGIVGVLRSRSAADHGVVGALKVQSPPPPSGGDGVLPPAPPLPARL